MIYGLLSILFWYLAKKDFEKKANFTGWTSLIFSAGHAAYFLHIITA